MKTLIKNSIATIAFSLITAGSAFAGDAKATLETLNQNWNQAFNNADAAALSNLYSENALLSPGNGKVLKGRAEIENLFKSFFQAGLHHHKLEIVATGGDDKTIYQIAKWAAEGANKDGAMVTYGGITTSVYEKDANGQWVTRSHVWNASN